MNIQLLTGKTAYISTDAYVLLSDEEFDRLYRDMIADDVGDYLENPFSNLRTIEVLDFEIPEIE